MSSLIPGLPSATEWQVSELRYNRPAHCLVALLLHRQRTDEARIYLRTLSETRYRRIRVRGAQLRNLQIALASEAPTLFLNGWRRRKARSWDWDGLFIVDLQTTRVRQLKGLARAGARFTVWVSQLLGCDAAGKRIYIVLARERPMTHGEFARLMARLRREGVRVLTAPKEKGTESERRKATHVDYFLAEYSLRARHVRDITLLPGVFA